MRRAGVLVVPVLLGFWVQGCACRPPSPAPCEGPGAPIDTQNFVVAMPPEALVLSLRANGTFILESWLRALADEPAVAERSLQGRWRRCGANAVTLTWAASGGEESEQAVLTRSEVVLPERVLLGLWRGRASPHGLWAAGPLTLGRLPLPSDRER